MRSSSSIDTLLREGSIFEGTVAVLSYIMSSEGAAVAALTLDVWSTKVEACAEQVKTLKTTDGVEKEAVGAAVTALLDAKRSYAKLNKGIGIDGKPFEEPMSKADKKKQKKQGTPAGPAKEVRPSRTLLSLLLL
jgi:hypothetical protein